MGSIVPVPKIISHEFIDVIISDSVGTHGGGMHIKFEG